MFGPYTVNFSNGAQLPTYTQRYTITVWAADPGLSPSPNPQAFTKIGEVAGSITAGTAQTVSKTVSVPATLTTAFADIKVTVSFSPALTPVTGGAEVPAGTPMTTFPSVSCGQVTPGLNSTTDACLQAAVNPTGVLVPDVVPLTIVYEPPGNCSWSNLTFSSSVGSEANLTESVNSDIRTMYVYKADYLSPTTTTTYEENVESTKGAFSRFSSTTKVGFGSAFGLPLESPGSFACKAGQAPAGPSPTTGPGLGDQFVFAVQPTFLFWNTGGREGFRLSTSQLQGTQPTIGTAYVRQIDPDHPDLAPSFLARMSSEQLRGLRALDAMAPVEDPPPVSRDPSTPVSGTSGRPLPANRYVFVGRQCNSAGSAIQTTQGNEFDSETWSNISSAFATIPNPSVDDELSFGRAYISGIASVATAAITKDPKALFSTFSTASSLFDKYIATDVVTTTIAETFTSNTGLRDRLSNKYAQSFFLQDIARELDVDIYYDTFFGTFLFNPLASCDAPSNVWHSKTVEFDTDSAPSPWPYFDWVEGQFKGQCPAGSPVVGLSASGWGLPHSILCRNRAAVPPLPFENPGAATTSVEVFSDSNSGGYGVRGDWDYGAYKGECPNRGFVTGVARGTDSGIIDHIECATSTDGQARTNDDCELVTFPAPGTFGDNPAWLPDGDWANGFSKLECSPGKVVVGVSSYSPWSGPPAGLPHGILCCGVSR